MGEALDAFPAARDLEVGWGERWLPFPLLSSPLQRLFVVPANKTQAQIPYARVNHNKYMVSDQVAYIGE